MDVLRPSGPLPARVYWVRRAVVLVVLAAVVALLVVGVKALAGGGGAAADDPAGTGTGATAPAADPGADTDAAGDDGGTPACDPAALTAELVADAAVYPGGAQPLFTLRLTNAGSAACLVDAGDAQRQLVITSGSDRIWASTDCPTGEALQLLLAPGQADERQVQWDRVRSAEGCPPDQQAARAGTYQATLTLAGAASEPVVFGLE